MALALQYLFFQVDIGSPEPASVFQRELSESDMFSKIMGVLFVMMLPVLGVSAHAASAATPTMVVADGEESGGTDCFFKANRSLPECQTK